MTRTFLVASDRGLKPTATFAGSLRDPQHKRRKSWCITFASILWFLVSTSVYAGQSVSTNEPPPPTTPRGAFNAGTQKLQQGKLREAEALLETAMASQNERLQPASLYNLGHVRFDQGVEELKKAPSAGQAASRGRSAARQTDDAIHHADDALAGNDLDKLVAAYVRGRGARKELKAAAEAVRRALEAHRIALTRWQRALGDFKSAAELDSADSTAQRNADVVDRNIAKLVDSLRELQQCASDAGEKNRELGDKLKQLKGRIPAPNMPPGGGGEEEEDDDFPFGPEPGQKEGPSKEGQEMSLSPEQAGWLLEGFQLDSDRRLPMSWGQEGQPRERNRPTW